MVRALEDDLTEQNIEQKDEKDKKTGKDLSIRKKKSTKQVCNLPQLKIEIGSEEAYEIESSLLRKNIDPNRAIYVINKKVGEVKALPPETKHEYEIPSSSEPRIYANIEEAMQERKIYDLAEDGESSDDWTSDDDSYDSESSDGYDDPVDQAVLPQKIRKRKSTIKKIKNFITFKIKEASKKKPKLTINDVQNMQVLPETAQGGVGKP